MSSGAPGPSMRTAWHMIKAVAVAMSTSTIAVPGGIAVLNRNFPAAHSLNRLLVDAPTVSGLDLIAAADRTLGGVGLLHRSIEVFDVDLGRSLAQTLKSAGYSVGEQIFMAAADGREGPTAPRDTAAEQTPPEETARIVELELSERAEVASAGWRRDQPEWDDGVVSQLGERIRVVPTAAKATFFAIRNERGRVVSHADLYLRDGVAQIEEVMTAPDQRGQGLASVLLQHAVATANAAGAGPIFLIADAEDWPQHLYRRLGFTEIGRTICYTKVLEAAQDG